MAQFPKHLLNCYAAISSSENNNLCVCYTFFQPATNARHSNTINLNIACEQHLNW